MKQPTYKGQIFFPDLMELETLDHKGMLENYTPYMADIYILPIDSEKYLFKCDLPNTDFDYGGFYKCYLYNSDNKILGDWHYLKEANLDDMKVDGSFKINDNIFTAKAKMLEKGNPIYGMYVWAEKI